MSRLGPALESCESLLGFREFLVRLSHAPAQGKRIALHDLMHEVEEIGHTEALQPLFGELNQSLGPITDQIEDLGSQSRESLIHQRFPRGIGPIFCHLFQQQISRFQIHKDQNHLFKKVSSTAPMISRTSPVVVACFSHACAVSTLVFSSACITPRKAEGEHPTCVSRRRRAKNSLIVSIPTPRLRPKR